MIFDMLEYYNIVKNYNIEIIYSGPIWASGIEGIGETLRRRLEFDDVPFSASQSVFSVFVEQMNNMLMYSEEKGCAGHAGSEQRWVSRGVFVLGVHNRMYFIQSGNVVKNESVGLLKERIDYLNTLDKCGLRKFYKEQIKNKDTNCESKGAGIGLTEIARRASSKIEYSFTPLSDERSFYTMFVAINQGGE